MKRDDVTICPLLSSENYTWSINPSRTYIPLSYIDLPPGLSFKNGIISGSPIVSTKRMEYNVTVVNSFPSETSVSQTLGIEIYSCFFISMLHC